MINRQQMLANQFVGHLSIQLMILAAVGVALSWLIDLGNVKLLRKIYWQVNVSGFLNLYSIGLAAVILVAGCMVIVVAKLHNQGNGSLFSALVFLFGSSILATLVPAYKIELVGETIMITSFFYFAVMTWLAHSYTTDILKPQHYGGTMQMLTVAFSGIVVVALIWFKLVPVKLGFNYALQSWYPYGWIVEMFMYLFIIWLVTIALSHGSKKFFDDLAADDPDGSILDLLLGFSD